MVWKIQKFHLKKFLNRKNFIQVLFNQFSKQEYERALYCLEKVGISKLAYTKAKYLSGGEKQRISIARMILKNAPILILDEAMAAVDSENERLIGEAIDDLSKDKIIITIAHHLNTIRDSDQIIVMDKGVVLDAGSHEELMKRCEFYKDMVEAQNKVDRWNLKEVVTENV